MYRTPQRTYTHVALEAWFERMGHDWESWFGDAALKAGRRLYCEEEIRSTELMENSAIVHFRRGKQALYVIVDWRHGVERPEFRQSDPQMGEGLAVAGLYVLDEMVAEEIPAVAVEGAAQQRLEGAPPPQGAQPAEQVRSGRTMALRAWAEADGLHLEAYWLGDKAGAGLRLAHLTRWEREQYIRLAGMARRGGFEGHGRKGRYRLQEPDAISRFLRQGVKDFRQHYEIAVDGQLAAWASGLRNVEPEVSVRGAGVDVAYKWAFWMGGAAVDRAVAERWMRRPGEVQYVPGVGIGRLSAAAHNRILDWKEWAGGLAMEGVYPRWLLWRLSAEPGLRLKVDAGLARWQAQLRAQGAPEPMGPDYLRGYQKLGVGWLHYILEAGCHPLLADEMGLGKTLQVIALMEARGLLAAAARILIVCPASVVPVWQSELERFAPTATVGVVRGGMGIAACGDGIWLISYTQLRRQRAALAELEFELVVLDEAQVIKNPDAKVSHACCAVRARARLALTGTPMENRPLDLWSLYRYLMPGLLGSRQAFERKMRLDGQLAALRGALAPFILRRTKAAVLGELPEKIETVERCALTGAQRRAYREVLEGADSAQLLAEGVERKRMHIFALLTRLRQVCCDPRLLKGGLGDWRQSGKLEVLAERLESVIASGSKVVIFSQFVEYLGAIERMLRLVYPQWPVFKLTGATVRREKPVQAFAEAAGSAGFLVSLRAGGTGLNLQMADYVFLMDPWWNPAVEAQAMDRVHRMGQRNTVFVYRMVAAGTIEERIERLKAEKGALFDTMLADMDAPGDLLGHIGADLAGFMALEEGQ